MCSFRNFQHRSLTSLFVLLPWGMLVWYVVRLILPCQPSLLATHCTAAEKTIYPGGGGPVATMTKVAVVLGAEVNLRFVKDGKSGFFLAKVVQLEGNMVRP
jgi:hypothetical protein